MDKCDIAIIKEYKYGREGNDCYINDYVYLIHIDSNLYVVNHTDTVYGSWTGNPKTTNSSTFDNYNEALEHYEALVNKFKRYE